MKENTDTRKLTTELIYSLDVRIPDQIPRNLPVNDRLLAGLDPRNDLILINSKISAKHFLFRKRNNVLTVHYLGKDGNSFLNGLPLENGKIYVLEKSDILKVGKLEIMIRRERGSNKTDASLTTLHHFDSKNIASVVKPSTTAMKEEIKKTKKEKPREFQYTEMPIPTVKLKATKKEPVLNFSTINLIPYKFFGFIFDVAFTYFILSFAVPSLGVLSLLEDLLYPITEFISPLLTTYTVNSYGYLISPILALSLVEFFICFHILMIGISLVLGTTPGAFLIGLHPKNNGTNLLARRFKAYLYALFNIVMLPLIFFDIPFYKGRNVKELLSFSEREINTATVFKISRRAIAPVLILAGFLSPFFLKPPFTATITNEINLPAKYKDVHTSHLSSFSKNMGLSLNADLSNQYVLLPYFENQKIGLILYDLKNKKSLIMQEQGRFPMAKALYRLRYSNPLSSFTLPQGMEQNEMLKKKAIESLNLSLTTILPGVSEFGPLLSNGFLFKDLFLHHFDSQDNFFLNAFDKKNPVLKMSSPGERVQRLFLFAKKEIIEFTLTSPKQTNLMENFTSSILAGFAFDKSKYTDPKNPQILEVLEAFERANAPLILTYYINEAKKIQELNNPEGRDFFIKSLKQTKRALMNRKSEKSFDDIIATL